MTLLIGLSLPLLILAMLAHARFFLQKRAIGLFLIVTAPMALANDPSTYEFSANFAEAGLHVGNYPLINYFAFLFVFYIAFQMALTIVRNNSRNTVGFVPLWVATVAIFTGFGVCVELLNHTLQWWMVLIGHDVLTAVQMWIWRPMMGMPPFLSLMLPKPWRWIYFFASIGAALAAVLYRHWAKGEGMTTGMNMGLVAYLALFLLLALAHIVGLRLAEIPLTAIFNPRHPGASAGPEGANTAPTR